MPISKQARPKGTFLPCPVSWFVPCTSCYVSLAQQFWSSCLITACQIYPLFRQVSCICVSLLHLWGAVPQQVPFSPFNHPVVLKYLSSPIKMFPSIKNFCKANSNFHSYYSYTPHKGHSQFLFPSEDYYFGELAGKEWLTAFRVFFVFLPNDWLSIYLSFYFRTETPSDREQSNLVEGFSLSVAAVTPWTIRIGYRSLL